MSAGGTLLWTAGSSSRMPAALPALAGVSPSVRNVGSVASLPAGDVPDHPSWRRRLSRSTRQVLAAPIRVVVGPPSHIDPADRSALEQLLAQSTLPPPVLAVVPAAVLAADGWRHDVWSGQPVTQPCPTEGSTAAEEQLRELVAARHGTRVVQLRDDVLAGAGRDPWWGVSARGMEVLRRMNAHAADERERRLFRDVVTSTFVV